MDGRAVRGSFSITTGHPFVFSDFDVDAIRYDIGDAKSRGGNYVVHIGDNRLVHSFAGSGQQWVVQKYDSLERLKKSEILYDPIRKLRF